MKEFALVVLGAIVGALATGGISAWELRSQRQTGVRVAARLILGDLYVMEGLVETVLKNKAWPDRLDARALVERMTQTWMDRRAAFARGVEAWEWALVDGLYSNLERTVREHQPGETCTRSDLTTLEGIQAAIPDARQRVLERAATEQEREQLVSELSKRRSV